MPPVPQQISQSAKPQLHPNDYPSNKRDTSTSFASPSQGSWPLPASQSTWARSGPTESPHVRHSAPPNSYKAPQYRSVSHTVTPDRLRPVLAGSDTTDETSSSGQKSSMGSMIGSMSLKREGDQLSIDRSKRFRSVSPAMSDVEPSESRGLFVRPQQVLYVVDAVGTDI